MAARRSPLPRLSTANPAVHSPAFVQDAYGTNSAAAPAPDDPSAISRQPSLAQNNGDFAYHQPQPQHPRRRTIVDDDTYSNTLANAQAASPTAQSLESPLRPPKFTEEWDASVRGSSVIEGPPPPMQRSNSISSRPEVLNVTGDGSTAVGSLSRGNTLKKKGSLRSRSASLKKSGSRRSMKAGSVKSLALQSTHDEDQVHSAFFCPVPTSGNPTEVLANRFQAWRKMLKDLISYFKEIQSHYEHRSKSLVKLANVLNNTSSPPGFIVSGGLDDALQMMRNYHKTAIFESNKAREIEEDVILALTGLRSDLNQKIKEIKSLSGDFKNSVDKEMDNTKRAVNSLQEVLGQSELDSALTTGKQDPYLLRLAVDRQVERQIDEENYLHQAYRNLEASGRELESIVVGEIQKSYNAYAGILKREADAAYNAVDELREGPIAMPKDHEWQTFIQRDSQFVDPSLPIRAAEHIHYPGRDHYACQEIRAGLLERKSKYLKSYTAGWYVLSPTHLHEFKSADKAQAPIMSLYLPEQKLGSHSVQGGSSNKFILKGRQTGTLHRGHTWVFRAESHDTMMAWYEDIKTLTEKSPEERSTFVRGHQRTYSRSSQRSVSSDGLVDEDDEEPFVSSENAAAVVASPGFRNDSISSRPRSGGKFPSDLQVNAQRGLQAPMSPSSGSSQFLDTNQYTMQGANAANGHGHTEGADLEAIAAAGGLPDHGVSHPYLEPGNGAGQHTVGNYGNTSRVNIDAAPSHAAVIRNEAMEDGINPYSGEPTGLYRNPSERAADAPVVVEAPQEYPPLPYRGPPREVGQQAGLSNGGGEQHAAAAAAAPDVNSEPVYTIAPLPQFADYGGPQQQQQAMGPALGAMNNAENGSGAGGGSGVSGIRQQPRPLPGARNDSIPHVPGEFPRGTPLATPGPHQAYFQQ